MGIFLTSTTLRAKICVDLVWLPSLTTNRPYRTNLCTKATATAQFRVYNELQQSYTMTGRAAFFPNMGLIFVSKVVKSTQDRVRG